MTIFQSMLELLAVALFFWLTLFFSSRFNEYFVETYNHKAWSIGGAVIQAGCAFFHRVLLLR
jgi:hypothetical protein